MKTVDVLMLTYNAAAYVELSLPRLLESCDDDTRVWLWHNGNDQATLEIAQHFARDARVHRFHHSEINVGLREPTNWVWREGSGDFVSKVDDDCLLPTDWIARLRHAHASDDRFGAIGASRLRPEDLVPELIERKLAHFNDGTMLFRNHWVQGSGYLLKREWIRRLGPLADGQSWTSYCMALAFAGAINGFLYPLIFEDHMDDPRSEHTLMRTDEDLAWRMPLSAKRSRVRSLEEWQARLERSALDVQKAPLDLRHWRGWRRKIHNLRSRLAKRRPA